MGVVWGPCSMRRTQPVSSGLDVPTNVAGQGRSQAGSGPVGGRSCWTLGPGKGQLGSQLMLRQTRASLWAHAVDSELLPLRETGCRPELELRLEKEACSPGLPTVPHGKDTGPWGAEFLSGAV